MLGSIDVAILDPAVGQMHLPVEEQEIVVVRPLLDLALVAIGSAVGVRSIPIAFVEPLRVLAVPRCFRHESHRGTTVVTPISRTGRQIYLGACFFKVTVSRRFGQPVLFEPMISSESSPVAPLNRPIPPTTAIGPDSG
jgi:hypothetical protein